MRALLLLYAVLVLAFCVADAYYGAYDNVVDEYETPILVSAFMCRSMLFG